MNITIPNADESLIKVIECINEKLDSPYEIISNEVPNESTLQAMRNCAKGESKSYKNFKDYMQEVEDNA